MGMFEDKRFAEGTNAVARAVVEATQKNGAKSIIGGGDSVKALNKAEARRQSDFHEHRRRSEPGIFGRRVLPGVAALSDNNSKADNAYDSRELTNLTMNKERKLIIAGNWKMNKTVAEALDLVRGLKIELANVKEVDIVVCPPFTALSEVSKAILDSNIRLGAQNMSEHNVGRVHRRNRGGMLKEFSVRYVILGHSERRQYQKESDELIAKKAAAAHAASLQADRLRGRNSGGTRRRTRRRKCWKRKSAAASPA